MRKLVLSVICLVAVLATAGAAVCFIAYQSLTSQERADFEQVNSLLAEGNPTAAAEIIQEYGENLSITKPQGIDWLIPTVEALRLEANVPGLILMYQRFPRGFEDNEEATLLVAAGLLAQRKIDDYRLVRDQWREKTQKPPSWFVLDVDALLVDGKRQEALDLLNSTSFEGSDDTGRLVRLALIHAKDNLETAWNILAEALAKDPTNTDVTSYRAQILEAIKKPALARLEYLSAIQKDPDNAYLVHQLAEFYRRHGHYALALEAWTHALDFPDSDVVWLKTSFWERMAVPLQKEPASTPQPDGDLTPLVNFVRKIPEGQFWDEYSFEHVKEYPKFLRTQQETFWLRLAESFREGKEEQAAELLDFNVFNSSSWAPELEKALKQIVAYRRYGVLHIDELSPKDAVAKGAAPSETPTAASKHQFFQRLEDIALESPVGMPILDVPPDLQALLHSDYAYAAAFLANGWLEAALTFPVPSVVPDNYPDWLAFAYTQALRFTRGPLPALNFATKQKPNPALSLIIGELMVATGSPEAGIQTLKPLSLKDTDVGMRAAWLISLLHVERKEFNEARATIQAHPSLGQNIVGKETLARIALQQGDITRADSLYEAIGSESLEAKFYLARRAFSEKNYDRALKLTQQLIIDFPDNPQLRADLEKLKALTEEKKL